MFEDFLWFLAVLTLFLFLSRIIWHAKRIADVLEWGRKRIARDETGLFRELWEASENIGRQLPAARESLLPVLLKVRKFFENKTS